MSRLLALPIKVIPLTMKSGLLISSLLLLFLIALLGTGYAGLPPGGPQAGEGLPVKRLDGPGAAHGGVIAAGPAAADGATAGSGVKTSGPAGSGAPKSYYDLLLELEMYEYIPQEACPVTGHGNRVKGGGHLPVL